MTNQEFMMDCPNCGVMMEVQKWELHIKQCIIDERKKNKDYLNDSETKSKSK